jgi:hypothetical protein
MMTTDSPSIPVGIDGEPAELNTRWSSGFVPARCDCGD